MGGIARLALVIAAVVLLGGCRTVLAELDPQTALDRQSAERHRQQTAADLEACRKVSLLELDVDPFGPTAPDCTIVVWDLTMPEIQHETTGGVLPPKWVIDAASAGGFHEVCSIGSNYFEGWLKRLPPGRSTESWRATMWTRARESERTRAICDMLLR